MADTMPRLPGNPQHPQVERETKVRWHADNRTCSHANDDVCPTCDFDRYYASTYPDCPWRETLDECLDVFDSDLYGGD